METQGGRGGSHTASFPLLQLLLLVLLLLLQAPFAREKMQFVRNTLYSCIRWSEITLIDISNWYSVFVCTDCPAEVIHILFTF